MSDRTQEQSKTKVYHTVKDIAARWETCERSVRREIKIGNLIAHRFGRSVRISDEDLRVYERLRRGW